MLVPSFEGDDVKKVAVILVLVLAASVFASWVPLQDYTNAKYSTIRFRTSRMESTRK